MKSRDFMLLGPGSGSGVGIGRDGAAGEIRRMKSEI